MDAASLISQLSDLHRITQEALETLNHQFKLLGISQDCITKGIDLVKTATNAVKNLQSLLDENEKMREASSPEEMEFEKQSQKQQSTPVPQLLPTTQTPIYQQSQPSTSTPIASTKIVPSFKPITSWTEGMNVMLCREVELLNPFQHKDRTRERGRIWDQVAENLQKHGLNVNKRSVRDRFNLLKQQVRKKHKHELEETGMALELTPTEYEMSLIIEDIVGIEQEAKKRQEMMNPKEEAKVKDGVEMRKRSLVSFSETNKRIKGETDDQSEKRRNTGNYAYELLMKKFELDRETRERDFQLRREEAERKRHDEQRSLERKEREEERRREREEREEERRRLEEERKRRDDETRERRMDLLQQQMMQQSQMLMTLLEKQKKD